MATFLPRIHPEEWSWKALALSPMPLIAGEGNNAFSSHAEPLGTFTDCEPEASNREGGENGNDENEAESKIEL